jgi:hypothetical protein
MEGRDKVSHYFTRYAEAAQWQFVLGTAEGRPALLAFECNGDKQRPSHFVLLGWQEDKIAAIRDFLFAPYFMETLDWLRVRLRSGKIANDKSAYGK